VGSNLGGGEIFRIHPDRFWAHPASCTMGTGFVPGVRRLGRGIYHRTHQKPRLKRSRAIPLLSIWAIVACSRVNFTFTFIFCVCVCVRACVKLSVEYMNNIPGRARERDWVCVRACARVCVCVCVAYFESHLCHSGVKYPNQHEFQHLYFQMYRQSDFFRVLQLINRKYLHVTTALHLQ
jgi:hypothetical protein